MGHQWFEITKYRNLENYLFEAIWWSRFTLLPLEIVSEAEWPCLKSSIFNLIRLMIILSDEKNFGRKNNPTQMQ